MICTLFTGQTSKEGIFMRYSYEFKKRMRRTIQTRKVDGNTRRCQTTYI